MKKLHKTVLSLIMLAISLSACSNVKVTEKSGTTKVIDKDMNYTVTAENNPKFLEEPKDKELRFFNSLKSALYAERMEDYDIKDFTDKSIVKQLEKDNNILIFIFQNNNGKDCINTFKLRKKVEDNKIFYSEPIYGVGFIWETLNWWIDGIEDRVDKNEALKETIISELNMFNSMGNYNLGELDGKVQWGCTDDPKIKNLTINGKKPTEIIELKMDGDDVYFWYYENLEVDYDNIMDMEILY